MNRDGAKSREILASLDPMSFKRIETRLLVAKMLYDSLIAQSLTQQTFARMMGKQPSEVSKWLSGNHNFTIDTLSDISFVLNENFLVRSDYTNHRCKPILQLSYPNKKRELYGTSFVLNRIEETDYEPNNKMEKCLA